MRRWTRSGVGSSGPTVMLSPGAQQAASLVLDLDRHKFSGPPLPGHLLAITAARRRLGEAGFEVRWATVRSAQHSFWHLWRAAIRERDLGGWLFCDCPADHLAEEDLRSLRANAEDAVVFSAVSSQVAAACDVEAPVVVFGALDAVLPDEDVERRVLAVRHEGVSEPSEAQAAAIRATPAGQLASLLGAPVANMHRIWPHLPETGYDSLVSGKQRRADGMHKPPHDAAAWRAAFAAAGDGTSNPNMPAIRRLRALIWEQTEMTFKASLDGKPTGHLADLDLADPAPRTQRLDVSDSILSVGERPEVQVLEVDILDKADELAAQGLSVAVLNMAAASSPGGGVRDGAGAQEENLHRRSDAARFTMKQRENYPIPSSSCLLSQGVTVFRGSEKAGYPFLRYPFKVAMISCAATTHPRLTADREYASPKVRREMESKIGAIVQAAVAAGCDAAILSAFGCGAFGNPPEAVAEMFRAQLERAPLRQVTFCIFDDHNAGHGHNPRGNFEPFKTVFGC